ncbi:MAG: GH3 auxin-responsive promoter family protein [bacterium]|nr:GH3 auxin-responsive promoter family protein [bacterium]
MGIKRTILRPVAYLAGLHANRQRREFLDAHNHSDIIQKQLLDELIELHATSDFGRDHSLKSVKSIEDFRTAVPVRSYEDLRPYMERVFQGQTTALLPPGHDVLMFSLTSGTTGKAKHIPVTQRFADTMRRGSNIWGIAALRDHPAGWLRPILRISSPMCEYKSPTGIPCGAISGLLMQNQKKIVRRMYVTPAEVAAIEDPQVKYYTICRFGAGRDVSMIITANPSSTITMIETGQQHAERLIRDISDGTLNPPGDLPRDIAETAKFKPDKALARKMQTGVDRDGILLPRHFWNPSLLANWTGGTLKLYLKRLGELFGNVPLRDLGLLASEGRFSLPLSTATSSGIAEITGNFLEFIPAEQHDNQHPDVLSAHELQVGQEYFLIVTNWAGLWRYNLDDRIRVTGYQGKTPIFEFLSRGLHTANITGEKITEHQVVEAMQITTRKIGTHVDTFVLQGHFDTVPYYQLRIEAEQNNNLDKLAEVMDLILGDLNIEYGAKRKSGRLGPIRPTALPTGTLKREEQEKIIARRGRNEQYKHQYLNTSTVEN